MRVAPAAARRAILLLTASAAAMWATAHWGAVYVGGDSMAPSLRRGDVVVLERMPVPVREGDVVLASKPGWPKGVLHRVTEVRLDGRYVFRGDANPIADLEPVPRPRILGRVLLVLPTGRLCQVVIALSRMLQSHAT